MTLDPQSFASDGRIQVQDPCAPTTEVLTYYSQFELYNGWSITIDHHHAAYMLQLYRFDGSLFPRYVFTLSLLEFVRGADLERRAMGNRLYLTVRPPTMLPTTSLEAV